MNVRTTIAALTLLALMPASAMAAAPGPDATSELQFWGELGARVKITKRFRLSIAQLLRFDNNLSRLGKAAPELQASFELLDGLRLHAGYRLTADRRSEGDWRIEHRLFVGGRYSYDIGPIELGYRLEFQEDIYKKAGVPLNDHVLRNRVDAAYEDFDILTPFASFELVANLGGAPGTGLRDWRATGGVEFEFGRHGIELFYRLRRDFESPPYTDHIIGLGYQLELGRKKKGKKKD